MQQEVVFLLVLSGTKVSACSEGPTLRILGADTLGLALTHIPIARSLRRNLGAVGLPPVSSSSRQDFYKVADLRAPLIQMPQVMNLSMPSWTSAHPQVSDFASGCPASLASAQPVTSPRLGRNFAFGRSQLPSWALWIEHYQDPHR